MKALRVWERVCIHVGAGLFLASFLALVGAMQFGGEVAWIAARGGPWPVVAGLLVVVLLLAGVSMAWKGWVEWLLTYQKPWTAPLFGAGWFMFVAGIGLVVFSTSAAAPPEGKSRVPLMTVVSGFALIGLSFMANGDRFADSWIRNDARRRDCPACKKPFVPVDGRCPSCGDDAVRREAFKLAALAFGGIPAGWAIFAFMEIGGWNDGICFGLGFGVWFAVAAPYYRFLRRRDARSALHL